MPVRDEERLARFVLDHVLRLRPREHVVLETWDHALPWARPLVVEARRRGAEPVLVVEDEEAFFRSLALPRARGVPVASPSLVRGTNAYVFLPGPEAFPRLFGLPGPDLETVLRRHGATWWQHARRSRVRAVRLSIATVTPTAAARINVDLDRWRAEVLRASLVRPELLGRHAERLHRHLRGARRLRITHPNGTDLSFRLVPASWRADIGRPDPGSERLWTSLPTGWASVAIAGGSAEGIWEANRPSYHPFADPPVSEGARFGFSSGRLRQFSLERGGRAFARAYARGGRGRGTPRALLFGLNPAAGRAHELEEIASGSVSLQIGETSWRRGRNPSSFSYISTLHGADVTVDGRRRSGSDRLHA